MSALIETLSSYSWDAKVVLVMAAFAVTYGGFFLMVGVNKSKPLETLRSLIDAMVKVTECVVNFRKLPAGQKPLDQSVVQTAVYWTVRSVVTCVPQFFGFLGLGHEYIPSRIEVEELSKLWKILNVSHYQLDRYRQYIEENKIFEYYLELLQLFAMIPTDNIKILTALFDAKDGLKPLFHVSTQQQVGVEVLEKKNVLLLISSELEVNKEEIGIMVEMYKNTRQVCQYDLVCLTLGKTTRSQKEEFENMLNLKKLPWYLLHDEHSINRAVIKYIKEVWHFNNKPILVVLDPQGRVISQNSFANIRIWGGIDLSITIKTEAQLWSETSWGLELLLQTIDEAKNTLQWIKENERFICLYGGEDINWIRDFTTAAREVAIKATNIQFEMVYIGARNLTKRVKENIDIIKKENLSNWWPAEVLSKFWVRLESMWHSRMQVITKTSIEEDYIMKEIKTMLTYDGSEKGWALISKGSTIMVKAKGDIILNCFRQFDCLKESFGLVKDFMEVIIDYVKKQEINPKLHCNRLILPVTVGSIPEELPCEICRCSMEKFVMYSCCKD
ncbi:protein SIEVE ELEMENT OCCLUSION A-like [Telopea speciosissima]|uniref:protein SIEVE ELEMENT OCCLUSION A-like n=1 Tax=Telopea speciosissima TaxID=54955 RepID=UPI001CC52DF0|nr:protein SIEVE ELEMENT OCCLUSION A-like [Telopea speciosissima]